MIVELKIEWEGDAPGLADHRLSIGQFGDALSELLRAVRRTASNILMAATDDTERGSRGGRRVADADTLDIEISQIVPGSTGLSMVVAAKPRRPDLFGDLAERVTLRLVEDIEAEAAGHPRSAAVRRFLKRLPPGLTRQRYRVVRDGQELRTADIGTVTAPEVTPELPAVAFLEGPVIALGFPPGDAFVHLRADGVSTPRLQASAAHVEKAVEFRGAPVKALALLYPASRLLWIRGANEASPTPSAANRIERLNRRWGDLLRKLAQ